MQLPPKNYDAVVKRANPPSPVVKDCLWAFFVGGAICLLGEALRQFYLSWYDKDLAGDIGLPFLQNLWIRKSISCISYGFLV